MATRQYVAIVSRVGAPPNIVSPPPPPAAATVLVFAGTFADYKEAESVCKEYEDNLDMFIETALQVEMQQQQDASSRQAVGKDF